MFSMFGATAGHVDRQALAARDGRGEAGGLSTATLADNFCAEWSGGRGFLDGPAPAARSPSSPMAASIHAAPRPVCRSAALAEERLDDILASLRGHAAFAAHQPRRPAGDGGGGRRGSRRRSPRVATRAGGANFCTGCASGACRGAGAADRRSATDTRCTGTVIPHDPAPPAARQSPRCWRFGRLARADARPMGSDGASATGRGGTVYFNAWGGDDRTNAFIAWAARAGAHAARHHRAACPAGRHRRGGGPRGGRAGGRPHQRRLGRHDLDQRPELPVDEATGPAGRAVARPAAECRLWSTAPASRR